MSAASSVRPYRVPAAGEAIAASAAPAPSATAAAASAVEGAARTLASGRCALSQCRHWAVAWGWEATTRMPPRSVPARASRERRTGTSISRAICSGLPVANSSRVPVTAPSTEFSKGTTAPSTEPSRTAAKASATVSTGISSASRLSGRPRSAVSANVPAGPR